MIRYMRSHQIILKRLAAKLDNWLQRVRDRSPDFEIGIDGDIYLVRWFVIPRNRFFNIYHHEIRRSDDDRALHDHPWHSLSLVTHGQMVELLHGDHCRELTAGSLTYRSATLMHRLILERGTCRTLFITGPRIREWGFLCPRGWVHWQAFTSYGKTGDSHAVGKGCGE